MRTILIVFGLFLEYSLIGVCVSALVQEGVTADTWILAVILAGMFGIDLCVRLSREG